MKIKIKTLIFSTMITIIVACVPTPNLPIPIDDVQKYQIDSIQVYSNLDISTGDTLSDIRHVKTFITDGPINYNSTTIDSITTIHIKEINSGMYSDFFTLKFKNSYIQNIIYYIYGALGGGNTTRDTMSLYRDSNNKLTHFVRKFYFEECSYNNPCKTSMIQNTKSLTYSNSNTLNSLNVGSIIRNPALFLGYDSQLNMGYDFTYSADNPNNSKLINYDLNNLIHSVILFDHLDDYSLQFQEVIFNGGYKLNTPTAYLPTKVTQKLGLQSYVLYNISYIKNQNKDNRVEQIIIESPGTAYISSTRMRYQIHYKP